MKTATAAFVLVLLQAASRPVPAQRLAGSQLDRLPAHIEALTHFGERADISPDSQSVAFMAKSFGDAMTIDLKTRAIRCLTCGVPAAAFLRVMHRSRLQRRRIRRAWATASCSTGSIAPAGCRKLR